MAHRRPTTSSCCRALAVCCALLVASTIAGCGGAKQGPAPSKAPSDPVGPPTTDSETTRGKKEADADKLEASPRDSGETKDTFEFGGDSAGGGSSDGETQKRKNRSDGDVGDGVDAENEERVDADAPAVDDAESRAPTPSATPSALDRGETAGSGGGASWATRRARRTLRDDVAALRAMLEPHGGTLVDAAPTALTCMGKCELARAICESSAAICDVAAQLPEARSDCQWAERECVAATATCDRCGGG